MTVKHAKVNLSCKSLMTVAISSVSLRHINLKLGHLEDFWHLPAVSSNMLFPLKIYLLKYSLLLSSKLVLVNPCCHSSLSSLFLNVLNFLLRFCLSFSFGWDWYYALKLRNRQLVSGSKKCKIYFKVSHL